MANAYVAHDGCATASVSRNSYGGHPGSGILFKRPYHGVTAESSPKSYAKACRIDLLPFERIERSSCATGNRQSFQSGAILNICRNYIIGLMD